MEIMSSFCVFKIISLTDVGIEGYILLYGLAVYNISEEEQTNFEIPEKDMFVIRKVREWLIWVASEKQGSLRRPLPPLSGKIKTFPT